MRVSEAPEAATARPWLLYVLLCGDGSLYAGVTPDLEQRLAAHRAGRGARYTRGRAPLDLLRAWSFVDVGAALKAERRFKRLPRARKLRALVSAAPP